MATGKLRLTWKTIRQAGQVVSHRRATIAVGSDADTFFFALNLRLETIAQSGQPNPSSVELTISVAKRFMARPEHRIQLDELITALARQTIADFAPQFAGGTEVRSEDFGAWVSVYESTVEPLAHLAAVLGRWGTGSELSLVLDAIKGLYAAALKEQLGFLHWLSVKNYPAALVMYGYALLSRP